MARLPKDLTGQRFGHLTALDEAGKTLSRTVKWRCRCDCGNDYIVDGRYLRAGRYTDCGCKRPRMNVRHGHTRRYGRTPEYRSWNMMLQRCENPNMPYYEIYGGRGIRVCERWHDFRLFLEDMGPRPDGKTLDRRNPDGNYEPGNVQWSTAKEQAAHRRRSGRRPRKAA